MNLCFIIVSLYSKSKIKDNSFMNVRWCIVVFLLASSISLLVGQDDKIINWMTWEEVQLASKKEQKKIFVDLYTDWCGWCKKMDAKTLSKNHIIQYLNEHYYSIKFDAQNKNDITFKDKVYKYVSSGRNSYNELAIELTKGKLSFPTVVFLDEALDVIQPIPGFLDAEKFEKIMTYFAGDYHMTTPWREYERTFNSQYYVPASVGGK
jgi:thioredoxin-related protein